MLLMTVAATPAAAIVIDFNAPAYTNGPLSGQNDPLGFWNVTPSDSTFLNVENTATDGRLVIQPNPSGAFHVAMLFLNNPIMPDANNKIIASFDLFESPEGADSGNIWKMMLKDAQGADLARIQGHKNQAFGRLPQAGGMITPPMLVGGGNPTTRTMFIEIDTSGDGGLASYYQDSISPANLLGSFPYTTPLDDVALIQIENFNRADLADNSARIDNITVIGRPESQTWNIDANGNWSDPGNWFTSVPNAAGVAAAFGNAIQSPRTITVDTPITVGAITFDNANSYTVAGTNALTLDATSGQAQLNVASGSHTISAPLNLADPTTVTVTPAGSNLSLTGILTATGQNLTKAGAGTLRLNNIKAASLAVNEGTITVAPNGSNTGTSAVGSLSIAGGAAPTARLDLTNNAAVVNYTGDSPAATIRQQILAGRGGTDLLGAWDGQGITSSSAAADPSNLSVGFANNADLPLGSYMNFRGEAVDDTTVLIRTTRIGDANLDGIVGDEDVTIVGATFGMAAGATWALGDFNYDGAVDDTDVTLVSALYDPSATPLPLPAANSVAAVPEPSAFGLLAIATVAFAIRLAFRRPIYR
jgi:hypothetical protein